MSRSEIRVRQEGAEVQLVCNGRLIATLPPHAAAQLARAVHQVAKRAEEYALRDQIILDHAILTRAGFPIGLTNRADFQQEVAKEAAWNGDLRRYMPGGVRSREVVGTPTIINHGGING